MQAQFEIWGVSLALILGALVLVLPLVRQWIERRQMEKRIVSVGVAQLKNVLLDDGMGGQSFYERMLLTPKGILVLFSNFRDGIIFGGERMDSWAQVQGKRTTRFTNPLYSIESQLTTLRYYLPKVAVSGNVLFMGDCSFPKGKPEGVWTLEDLLAAENIEDKQPVAPQFQQAWEKISQRARPIDPRRDSYLLPVNEGASPLRGWLALVLLGFALAWPLWQLW